MSETNSAASKTSRSGGIAWERTTRLWAGLILFVFVLTHLLNHAVGIFGVDAMQVAQNWRVAVWRSMPGTVLLYGAALLHILLAVKRIVQRRTWRMPVQAEWLQEPQICICGHHPPPYWGVLGLS